MGGGDHRDLKVEAAAIGGGDRDLKMRKEVVAFDTLETEKAVASEAADDRDLINSKAAAKGPKKGEILRLKKAMNEAFDHWFQIRRKSSKAMQQVAKEEKAPSKRKKVVKVRLPVEYVDHMAACPFSICADISDERLAQYIPEFREIYAAGRLLEAKHHEYWNALIAQQAEFGYAEDEEEITDEEDENEEVVRNN